MLGRLLAEWDERPAGALLLLPLWNPVLAAEQLATLACLKPGPFIMQCGNGRDAQFRAMGADIRYRPSMFEEAVEMMRRLWVGDTVSSQHRYRFENARISPTPPEPIAVWIGASAPKAIDRAARIGDAWLAAPGLTLDQALAQMDDYQAALARHSRSTTLTAIRRDVYVAESEADASAVRELVASRSYRGFDPSALMIGTPEQVAGEMQAFGDGGYTDIIVRNLHRDPGKAIASTERLAEVVEMLRG